MQIKRKRATQIMSKALALHETSLLAVMDTDQSIHYASDQQDLEILLQTYPGATLIHNQNEQALQIVEQINHPEGQHSLEVFQDTEGVFGLRAYQMVGKLQTPVTLELSDE